MNKESLIFLAALTIIVLGLAFLLSSPNLAGYYSLSREEQLGPGNCDSHENCKNYCIVNPEACNKFCKKKPLICQKYGLQ